MTGARMTAAKWRAAIRIVIIVYDLKSYVGPVFICPDGAWAPLSLLHFLLGDLRPHLPPGLVHLFHRARILLTPELSMTALSTKS